MNYIRYVPFIFGLIFIIWGWQVWRMDKARRLERKSKKKPSIYEDHSVTPKGTLKERAAASWKVGWQAGMAYGTKKREEREASKK